MHHCAFALTRWWLWPQSSLIWPAGLRNRRAMQDHGMNVLILGSGAREHALARACVGSPRLGALFVAPGNPGCAKIARTVALEPDGPCANYRFLPSRNRSDLVVVGPEAPLVAGIADDLATEGITCLGPSRAAAQLEGSKSYAKDFCREFGIPTAEYRCFSDRIEAKAYIRERGAPIVVKADGLAAGKGVVVAETIGEAEAAVDSLSSAYGSSTADVGSRAVSQRRRSFVLRALRRRHRRALSQARRTISASATETPGRTPAGWGRTRRPRS